MGSARHVVQRDSGSSLEGSVAGIDTHRRTQVLQELDLKLLCSLPVIGVFDDDHEAHVRGTFTERRNATTAAADIQAEARSRGDAVGNDSSSLLDVYVCLSKMDCGIAERDNSSRRVRIELVQEWKLRIANDASSMLRPVLETH